MQTAMVEVSGGNDNNNETDDHENGDNDDDNTNTIFEVERMVDEQDQFITIATIPGDQNTFLDENLLSQKSYTYRVRSGDGVYYSDYSNIVKVFTGNNHP